MAADREDELARTATAPAGSSTPATPAEAIGATLGRYRLERELGSGGMGVVHAAFDPDLERRIALKVLRSASGDEAQKRLLREARAMARLTHANVVTVHEVGSANGRDFVAMELIDGETLADWIRAEPRGEHAIVDAFLAAGRGLAAAHRAGIVHRDFKPHNVLRSRDGRIVVTDFGLARDATPDVESHLATTLPLKGSTSGSTSTPARATLRASSVWEALAGGRLRAVLRRGLAPDPARRWPSMDLLLTKLGRAERRPGRTLAIAVIAAAVITALVILFALRERGDQHLVATCPEPARAITTVWSPAIAEETRGKLGPEAVAVIEREIKELTAARAQICKQPTQPREAQLHCLDGVLARIDVVRQAYSRVAHASAEDLASELVVASVCMKPDVPRLTLEPTVDSIAAYELFARGESNDRPADDAVTTFAARSDTGPCARAIALMVFDGNVANTAAARAAMSDAITAADQCGDDRIRADALIASVPSQYELPMIGPRGEAALKRAQSAALRVSQPDMDAVIALQGTYLASQRELWKEAFALTDVAIAGFGARELYVRQLGAVHRRNSLRFLRASPEDLAAIRTDVAKWKPVAVAHGLAGMTASFDEQDANARLWLGDVAGSHAEIVRLWTSKPHHDPVGGSRSVDGMVVDPAGKPVAGAIVAAGGVLMADPLGPIPLYDYDGGFRMTTTDASGHFALAGASLAGPIFAQHGDLRALPAAFSDHIKLVVRPTRSIRGRVTLGSISHTRVIITAEAVADPTHTMRIFVPITQDGSFVLDGIWTEKVRVGVGFRDDSLHGERSQFLTIDAGTAPVTGVALALDVTGRPLDVIARSAVSSTLDAAQIIVLPGHLQLTNVGELMKLSQAGAIRVQFAKPLVGEHAPGVALGKLRRGDLVAHFPDVPAGDVTVCAIGFMGELSDPAARHRMQAHAAELKLKCEHIGGDAKVVEVEAPPQQRFD